MNSRSSFAHGLDANYSTCADILLARPDPDLLPHRRGDVVAEINGGIAQLRFELGQKPKSVRPFPESPDFDFSDLERQKKQFDAYIKQINAMTAEETKYYLISNRLEELDQIADLVGRGQLDERVEAYQIIGADRIQSYLGKISAGECRSTFAPLLRRMGSRGTSALAQIFEKIEVVIRRKIAKWRDRSDFRCELYFPEDEGTRIAEKLNAFWSKDAAFSEAFTGASTRFIGPDFLEAFREKPDLTKLGWNGLEPRGEFLTRRRDEIIRDHVRFMGNTFGLRGPLDEAAVAARQVEWGHLGYMLDQNWIPGWSNEVGRPRAPVLTVIVHARKVGGAKAKPRRRAAVTSEAPALEWAPGAAVPAN